MDRRLEGRIDACMDGRQGRPALEAPRVNPVGVLETPGGFSATPRRYSAVVRALALTVLVAMTAVILVTTAYSLGRYCLTSQASAAVPTEVHP